MSTIHDILKQYWGYGSFRPLQEEIIRSAVDGHDTLALLPTGGGKSLCFQIPGMAREGVCIVVTPLIALMKDQVEQLRKRGILAAALHSGMHYRELDIVLDNAVYGGTKFLYVSPERLHTELFLERFKKMKVALIAIDEAHCISQWGYDFRPAYLEIPVIREIFPKVPVMAVTATATLEVREDIMAKLKFNTPRVYAKSFERPELSYSVFEEQNKSKRLVEILSKVKGTAVVYVRNRKRTQDVAQLLQKQGVTATWYHAGLTHELRNKRQEEWLNNSTRVMVATNAFGMGIDKPDVRLVVHLDLPDSPEAYFQEAGRAARDGQRGYAVLLYEEADITELKEKLELEYPSPEWVKKIYQSLANYYKIAVGSSSGVGYDFDLDAFSERYNYNRTEVFYGLKRLEHEGFITLDDVFYQPSRMMISVSPEDLYAFQVANEKHDELIKVLLRTYGGEMYSYFVVIDEKAMARRMKYSEEELKKRLTYLHQQSVLIYDPRKTEPQITFTTPRLDAAELPLNQKELEQRKSRDAHRMKVMEDYARGKEVCRTRFLLDYFGEQTEKDCGACDICLAKKKATQEDPQKVKELIKAELLKVPVPVNEITNRVSASPELVTALVRKMLDGGEIVLVNDMLTLKK